MDALRLYWLGPPRIELKGRSVKLETRKSAALLSYLSLLGSACQRETLAALLWPEGNQQRALGSLRRTLSSLKSRLPGWIQADHETITLKRNDKLWVDVDAFRELLAKCGDHHHAVGEPCDACLLAIKDATAFYRGDFLDGLNLGDCPNFDEWQVFQRDGLRQEFGGVLQRLAHEHAARQNWEEAIQCARRWVALDRLHEPACRTLMDYYARSGQRTAALRQYEELAQSLREQQEVEVEDETRRLYEQIESQGRSQELAGPSQVSSSLPLLKTKLYIPSPPAVRVTRSRLISRLDGVGKKALTLISAPAGFGKTTLLAEWIAQSAWPIAWLSLDHGDNDPYRFLSYLVEALRGIEEGLGTEALKIIQSSQLVPPHVILASLINDLERVAEPAVLVLDDYQFLTEPALHETVSYLLDHLPRNLHLIIATRADPSLPVGRLRANGQMLELRTEDLRFGPDEAIEFLNGAMRLGLSKEDIDALSVRTEGWVAGLKMAALSLQGRQDAAQFIRAFSGSHRYVMDYLMEEVLKRQPLYIQTFLLETSMLERLNGDLCDALLSDEWNQSGQTAQAVLEYLERSNLFLISLDDRQQWYRYHHLFADLLRSRLQQSPRELVVSLHTRASRWFERNGFFAEALFHAMRAGDFVRAASLIEQYAPQLMARNEFSFYLARLNEIPTEIAESRPWLRVYRAWGYARLGRLDEIEPLLQRAEAFMRSHPQTLDANEMAGSIALVRANVANLQGNSAFGIEQTRKAQELLPLKNLVALDNVGFQRAFAYFANGDFSRARQEWSEVARAAMSSEDFDTYANVAAELADLSKLEGDLRRAYSLYYDAQRWLEQQTRCPPMFLAALEIGIAELLVEWNKLEDANRWNMQGIGHARAGGRPNTECFGCYVKARLLLALQDLGGVQSVITEAESILSQHALYPRAAAEIETIRVRLWIAERKTSDLENWSREHQSDDSYAGDFLHEFINIARARALMAQGGLDEAMELLIRLKEAAERAGRNGRLIEILILQALVLQARGSAEPAAAALSRSLQLAEPSGYVRVFLNEGEPLARMLANLRDSTLEPRTQEYLNTLLAAFALQTP